MNPKQHHWLVRAFPPSWRLHHGADLEGLLAEMETEHGRLGLSDRLDVVASGLSERLCGLLRSLRPRQVVAPVAFIGAVVLTVTAVVFGNGDLHGVPRIPTSAISPVAPRMSGNLRPSPTTFTGGGGQVRFPGTAQMTFREVDGRQVRYEGSCSKSGRCTLVAVNSQSDCPATLTFDPSTGALLAIDSACTRPSNSTARA